MPSDIKSYSANKHKMFSPAGVLSAMHVKLESTTTTSIAVDWHDDDYREQAAQQQYLLT